MFYLQILSPIQKNIIDNLVFLKKYPFYLGGGTALALQLGHRTSLDFDFYSPDEFDNETLKKDFSAHFKNIALAKTQPENTFQIKNSGVNLSIFYYPYKLLEKTMAFPPLQLASLSDIAAMKVVAIVQRAKQRDFFDLYYLIRQLSLPNIIKATINKYPWYQENTSIILTALTYFQEADQDEEVSRIQLIDKDLGWEKIKKNIRQEVEKLQ